MARLQWNNVTTPDFTAAASLQESANKALDGALTGVTDFVTRITTRQREADEAEERLRQVRESDDMGVVTRGAPAAE